MSSVHSKQDESTTPDNGDWGWEPLGSEDEEPENARAIVPSSNKLDHGEDGESKSNIGRNSHTPSAERPQHAGGPKKVASFTKPITGMVSSPSFNELEKAIGATLNLASNDSGELAGITASHSGTFPARLSSTNLTQQKVNQQRLRQQQHHQQNLRHSGPGQFSRSPHAGGYGSYGNGQQTAYATVMPPPLPTPPPLPQPSARIELSPFINESESRAIVLFHSVHVPAVDIRNACSKHGVLYYIRPEFHGRGVTLISYFDLRCAISAKTNIVEDLGQSADAAAHYSVMLHAANGNSEEFRLVIRNLPAESCSEEQVQDIFARYGQLRSIQKTFEEDGASATSPSSSVGPSDSAPTSVERNHPSSTNSTSPSSPTNSSSGTGAGKVVYTIEYHNIQDARLAASELSATSAQLWGADVTITFAPLEDRKQQLCRQLLATLSRWRTEMAAVGAVNGYNMSMSMQQISPHHHHQQQQQQQPIQFIPTGAGMGLGMSGGLMLNMAPAGYHPHGAGLSIGMSPMNMSVGIHSTASAYSGHGMDGGHVLSAVPMNALPYIDQQQRDILGAASFPRGGGGGGAETAETGAQSPPRIRHHPAFPTSPMHSALLPGTSLSNPNLFNLGLLAAQAEAQMQQQAQQQQQHQQQHHKHHNDREGDSAVHANRQYSNQQHAIHPQPQSNHNGSAGGSGVGRGAYTGAPQYHNNGSAGAQTRPLHHQHHHHHFSQQQQQQQQQYHQHQQLSHHQQQQQYHNQIHNQLNFPQQNGYQQHNFPPYFNTMGGFTQQMQQQQQQQVTGQQNRRGKSSNLSGIQPLGQTNQNQIDADFALDMKRLGEDSETRTTIMVRNIPNKYNQQMLLDEVNVHHEGTYDFFYLPIDFKNRCNVGYCFINFLEPRHIAPFVASFNGQRWKSFNSEKICAVSFARIQGKQAMIARFQNSSLLEKDDEYRPLLFYSSGPDRGKPEPFPLGSTSAAVSRSRQQQQQQQQQNGLQTGTAHSTGSGESAGAVGHNNVYNSNNNNNQPPRSSSVSPAAADAGMAACDLNTRSGGSSRTSPINPIDSMPHGATSE